jgi:hypothetical protein
MPKTRGSDVDVYFEARCVRSRESPPRNVLARLVLAIVPDDDCVDDGCSFHPAAILLVPRLDSSKADSRLDTLRDS